MRVAAAGDQGCVSPSSPPSHSWGLGRDAEGRDDPIYLTQDRATPWWIRSLANPETSITPTRTENPVNTEAIENPVNPETSITPTLIVEHCAATGTTPSRRSDQLEQSGSPVSIAPLNMWDLVNPMVSTVNMLKDLPISCSPIPPNPGSPDVVSIESMSPGPATSDQQELEEAMESLAIDADSPATKRARKSA